MNPLPWVQKEQTTLVAEFLSWYLPILHKSHAFEEVEKEDPAAQCLQPYVIDVMSSWNLPAMQLTHGCVDDGESRPAPHV